MCISNVYIIISIPKVCTYRLGVTFESYTSLRFTKTSKYRQIRNVLLGDYVYTYHSA